MITNSHKPKYSYLRRLLFLPLLFSVTFVFALRAHQKQMAEQQADLEAMVAEQQAVNEINAPDRQLAALDTITPAEEEKNNIREKAKLGNAKPLIIIDGKEQPAGKSVDDIDPAEIEKVNVYKDAFATEKYGEKGKNGVVLVTTKAAPAKNSLRPVTIVSFQDQLDDKHAIARNNKGGQKQVVTVGEGTPSKLNFRRDSSSKIAFSATPDDNPLYILDGKPISNERMKAIPSAEIQSVSVLKDKSATAVYGSAAKNGVVLITSKNAAAKVPATDKIEFTQADQEASFPGGTSEWAKYLERHLSSDVPVRNHAPVGTYHVTASFLVDKEGNISEITAKSEDDKDYGTAAETVRVIRNSGKWNPAKQNGRPVIYRQKQQIIFEVMKD